MLTQRVTPGNSAPQVFPIRAGNATATEQRTVAQNLRRIMSAGNLTAEVVAAKTGLHLRTIRGLIKGCRNPQPRTLFAVSQGLGISAEELLRAAPTTHIPATDLWANTAVSEVIQSTPELFSDWQPDDFAELFSRFGTGGQLTPHGVKLMAQAQNQARAAHEQLSVVLEGPDRELALTLLQTLYQRNLILPDQVEQDYVVKQERTEADRPPTPVPSTNPTEPKHLLHGESLAPHQKLRAIGQPVAASPLSTTSEGERPKHTSGERPEKLRQTAELQRALDNLAATRAASKRLK